MNDFLTTVWANAGWSVVWETTLALVAGLAAAALCRRRPARADALLVAAVVAALAAPLCTLAIYQLGWGLLSPHKPPAAVVSLAAANAAKPAAPLPPLNEGPELNAQTVLRFPATGAPVATDTSLPPRMGVLAPSEVPPGIERTDSWAAWAPTTLSAIWLALSAAALARLAGAVWTARRLLAASRPICDSRIDRALAAAADGLKLDVKVQVRISTRVRCPVIWCWSRRPVVLLPVDFTRATNERAWPGIFCHELAHWKRRDFLSTLAADLLCCAVPWHPLAWWAARRHDQLSELACDEWVVACGQSAESYADSLLDLVPQRGAALALAVLRNRAGLAGRIGHILNIAHAQPALGRRWLIGLAVSTLVVVVLAALAQQKPLVADEERTPPAAQSPAAPAEDRPASAAKVIVVQVTDPDGKPCEGARIWIVGQFGPEWRTDAKGRFQAAIPSGTSRYFGLNVEHPDFVHGRAEWRAADHQGKLTLPDTVTIKLDRGIVVGGVVRGELGEPIENARVKLYLELPDRTGGDYLDVRTGPDGRWRGHVSKDMRVTSLLLYHTHYVCVPISWSQPADETLRAEHAVSVMKRGHFLQGKVHDSQGKPVAKALVLTQPDNVFMEEADDDWTTTRTREDGSFAVHNLPEGPATIAVYADSYAPRRVSVEVRDPTPAVDVKLSPGGELNGQVVDELGKGAPDVLLDLRVWQPAPSFPLGRQTRTDGQGRFRLNGMPLDGWFELQLEKDGFLQTTYDNVHARREPYTFRILRPSTIGGQVIDDETGEPIKDFSVVQGKRWSRSDDMVFDHTNRSCTEVVHAEDGRFAVALDNSVALPPFPEVAVRVVARGYLPAQTEPVATGEQPASVVLRLKRGEPITGLVIDAAGQPAPKAQVAWVGPKRTAFIENGHFKPGLVYRPEIIVEADADGHFELPASRDDGLIVVLDERGYAQRRRSEHQAASPLRLSPWARIEGRALAGSHALANASVGLIRPGKKTVEREDEVSWWFHKQTDIDGRFAFDFVPSIPLIAACNRALLQSHKTPITPRPGETVDVDIGGHGSVVSGRLDRPSGLRIDKFTDEFEVGVNCTQVVAYPAEQAGKPKEARSNYVALLNSDGSFTIHDLPPGKYRLEANVHAAVPPDSCGLPVTIAAARSEFRIARERADAPLELAPLSLEATPGPQVGQMAPQLTGKTLSGAPFELTGLRGKPVLLDFWATWCGPCKAATPAIKHLYERYGGDGKVAFIGIDLDYSAEDAVKYVEETGIAWPQVATGSWGEDNPIVRDFAVTSVPSFWLLSADGTILARDIPLVDLERQLQAAVKASGRSD